MTLQAKCRHCGSEKLVHGRNLTQRGPVMAELVSSNQKLHVPAWHEYICKDCGLNTNIDHAAE